MKKLLLPLLAMSSGCMHVVHVQTKIKDCQAMSNNADKWVINKAYVKTLNGKLFVNLPKGTTWDITIYAAGSDKVIANTMMQQHFPLTPGRYDLEINHIKDNRSAGRKREQYPVKSRRAAYFKSQILDFV